MSQGRDQKGSNPCKNGSVNKIKWLPVLGLEINTNLVVNVHSVVSAKYFGV